MPDRDREKAYACELFKRLGLNYEALEFRERPDCTFKSEGIQIGLEITESTPSEVHWGRKIVDDLKDDTLNPLIFSTTHLRNNINKRTREEIFDDMFNNPDWRDMSDIVKEFYENVRNQWLKKRVKLNEHDYGRMTENWLLIWDAVGLENDLATQTFLRDTLAMVSFPAAEKEEFHRVYAISGDHTILFSEGKACFYHVRADEINLRQKERSANKSLE